MQLTQDDFENHLQYMWLSPTYTVIDMLIGYSYACASIKNGWHDDCMFLIEILREKEKLA